MTLKLKSSDALKRWTFDALGDEAAAADSKGDTLSRVEVLRENHPVHAAFIQREVRLERLRPRILAAIKAKDAVAFAQFTQDNKVREWAMTQVWRSQGHQRGAPKAGQRHITSDEREMLDDLDEVRERIMKLWNENGVRGKRRFGVSPEQAAVEYLMGPEKAWSPIPARLWPGAPKDRPRSWVDRREQLVDWLTNHLKNKRTKPRRRKPRR